EDIPYERYILYLDSGYLSAQAAEAGGLNACFARARRDGRCLLRLSDADRAAIYQLFIRLEKALKDDSPYGPALSEALLTELMILICRSPEEKGDSALAAADTDEKIQQALHYIQAHLGANLSCDALASRLYMSRSSFQHRFKAATGYAPHAYIRLKRLLYASELLADGEPALTAGRKCGYTDHSAFCHAFTAQFGMTPSAYRPRGSLIGPDE
ncbi:MAG: helix-turn-helix transcriptional regulator, partial [Clostridia bacterium]|nr:helix-turn-helix transcriptional regulator [Clostridia bacterium]